MEENSLRAGTPVALSADGGIEYAGVLAAFNDDFLMVEMVKRSPSFRPGTPVTVELAGRAYDTSVTHVDGAWVTLARPAELAGVAGRGAVRLAMDALPVTVKHANGRVDGEVVDVSASGARVRVPAVDAFVADATFDLVYRRWAGKIRVRRVEPAAADGAEGDAPSVHLGVTFEDSATDVHRQLIRAMGGIRSDS